MTPTTRIIVGDVRSPATWATIPPGSVQCVITSPPYYGLRSYLDSDHSDKSLELGSEPTLDEYLANMLAVFRLVRAALRDDGTLWVNMGDSYASGGRENYGPCQSGTKQATNSAIKSATRAPMPVGLQSGDLMGVPWRLALAMQADGWILRSDVVWAKAWETDEGGDGSVMPESVQAWRWQRCRVKVKEERALSGGGCAAWKGRRTDPKHEGEKATRSAWADCPGCSKCRDTGGYVLRRGNWRPTKGHEYIFQFAKSLPYYCDGEAGKVGGSGVSGGHCFGRQDDGAKTAKAQQRQYDRPDYPQRNRRSVWKHSLWRINTSGFPGEYCSACRTYYEAEYNDLETVTVGGKEKKRCVCGATDAWLSHFATFCEDLPATILPIAAPERTCPECGAPWAPVVDREPNPSKYANVGEDMTGGAPNMGGNHQTSAGLHRNNGNAQGPPSSITGWRPTCSCAMRDTRAVHGGKTVAGNGSVILHMASAIASLHLPVPCTVMDCFNGTGTVGVVAAQLGLNYIGIELSPDYADMSVQRIARAKDPSTFTKAAAPPDAPLFGELK